MEERDVTTIITAPSGHVDSRGASNMSPSYWRGRHDGFREGILVGIDIAKGLDIPPITINRVTSDA